MEPDKVYIGFVVTFMRKRCIITLGLMVYGNLDIDGC